MLTHRPTVLHWKIPARLVEIDRVCSEVTLTMERLGIRDREIFAVELLMREALSNAITHGSPEGEQSQVVCHLIITELEAIIDVTDQGPGFDWRAALKKASRETDTTGRGMQIYHYYATTYEFHEPGNRITLRRQYRRG